MTFQKYKSWIKEKFYHAKTRRQIGAAEPSSQQGMGGIPHHRGTAFRVWAPHAKKIYVAGTFNEWNKTANPLASEQNGYWSADVANAKAGDEYKYVIISEAVETFVTGIREAADIFLKNPFGAPLIPTWSRVTSAIPDFLERLQTAVEEDNRLD